MKSLGRRQCLRLWGALLVTATLALAGRARAEETAETIRLAIGGERTIELVENPSTGYRWHLNEAASRNLVLVAVADAGHTASKSGRIGAPGVRRFTITARQPGTAVVIFEYARPWESVAPARRHVVTVEIAGR